MTLVVPVEPPEVFEGYVLDDAFGNSRVYFPLLVAHAELFDEFRVDQLQGPGWVFGFREARRKLRPMDHLR